MSKTDKPEKEDAIDVEPPYDLTRLLIEGIAESCTDEMIQLYVLLILNANLDDSFKIEEVRRNKKRVMIKFNRTLSFDDIVTRQKKVPELCGKLLTFHKVRVPNTVRVSELASNCSKEILNLYFTNAKISHGGDVRSIKMFAQDNKALVQFRNYNKVEDVLSRTHIVCERAIKLEKYYGPIEDEYLKEEEETATMNEDDDDDDKSKSKSLAAIRSGNMASNIAIDRTKLIVSNIQENVSIQQLEFFIQLITNKSEINAINWSLDHKGKLLIDFKKEMDINRILREFQGSSLNNLNGKPVGLESVNVTRTIVVLVRDAAKNKKKLNNLKLDSPKEEEDYKPELIPATNDLLDLYFANKQRSGGGEVESIERKSSRYWLVVMRDQRVVKDILARKHTVDEKPIKVFPYFENFGLPYLFKPLFDEYASASSSIFKLRIKDERLRYFCRVKSLHKRLNDILSESNAVSRYNKSESNLLYVNYVERLPSKVPYMERIWRLRVKESIEYFLQVYKYEKLTLSFNQWATITKTKKINDIIMKYSAKKNPASSKSKVAPAQELNDDDDDDEDDYEINDDTSEQEESSAKYSSMSKKSTKSRNGHNSSCAVINVNETSTNVELSIVGPNFEVDRFIVKIKDIICKAYFTFELEEKIIKFKTYLYECEELLGKWLRENSDGLMDSDTEITLNSSKSDTSSSVMKMNKSRKQTIDEFISKLERDHLDMELSYGKLFQELGYTFLNQTSRDDGDKLDDDDDLDEEESDDEYKDFNDKVTNSFDEVAIKPGESESQMDKIKYTLDELRLRINDMRKKFRQFLIRSKRMKNRNQRANDLDENDDLDADVPSDRQTADGDNDDDDDDDDDNEEDAEFLKLCIYSKTESKIFSIRCHRKTKIKELKRILYDKLVSESKNKRELARYDASDILLSYSNRKLINDNYSISDYDITDKGTITVEFQEDNDD